MKRFLFLLLAAGIIGVTVVWLSHTKDTGEVLGTHNSMYYPDTADFFASSLKPFANLKPLSPPPRILITNQHVLAASLIAHQFALARDSSVTRVFLITQNNWNAGRGNIITSKYTWQTPLGTVQPDSQIIDALLRSSAVTDEESIFVHEHGITGVISYVAYAFPYAKVIPLVIRDGTPDEVVDALASNIVREMSAKTVMIGTIDMSHYLPKSIADAHDRMTSQAVLAFDYEVLPKLDIDTAPTLRTILKVAERLEQQRFVETDHLNSTDLIGEPDLTSSTSYLTGYFRGGMPTATRDVHVLFIPEISKPNDGVERLLLGNDRIVRIKDTLKSESASFESGAERNSLRIVDGKPHFTTRGDFAVYAELGTNAHRFTVVPLQTVGGVTLVADALMRQRIIEEIAGSGLPPAIRHDLLTTSSFSI